MIVKVVIKHAYVNPQGEDRYNEKRYRDDTAKGKPREYFASGQSVLGVVEGTKLTALSDAPLRNQMVNVVGTGMYPLPLQLVARLCQCVVDADEAAWAVARVSPGWRVCGCVRGGRVR